MKTIKRFEVGTVYSCRSVCDHNCVWSFTVSGRTARTITTADGKTFRIVGKLSEMQGAECVYPLGKYSMAPVLQAN